MNLDLTMNMIKSVSRSHMAHAAGNMHAAAAELPSAELPSAP
jgi:hypothetical protein